MVDILHRVGVKTPTPEKVYDALTTVDGLSGWWTEDTKGKGNVGDVLEFRFPVGGFDMEVVVPMSSPTLLVRGVSALVTRGGSGREPRIRQRSCRGYLLDIMYIIGVTGALSVASDWLLRSPRGWQRLLSSSGNAPELRFRSRGLLGAGLRLQAALGVGCLMRSLDDGSVDEAVDAGSVDGWVRWQARPGCR